MTPFQVDVDTLARTVWAEARGEGRQGMEAVAAVVMNRVADRRWPDTAAAVCRQHAQFSCWLESDPNLPKLLAVDGDDAAFRTAYAIAAEALAGTIEDRTQGANHYFATSIPAPAWAKPDGWTCTIGHHRFYRL